MKVAFPLLIGITFFHINGCDFVQNQNCSSSVNIELPLMIFPAQDTFVVGDTIWITSIVPGEIKDTKSGAVYKGDDYFAPLSFGIEEEFVPDSLSAGKHFNVFAETGELEILYIGTDPWIFKGLYAEGTSPKEFKIGVIPEKKGLFGFRFFLIREDYFKIDFDKKCIDYIDDYTTLTNGGESNYHLFNGFVPFSYGEDGFKIRGGFAFRVVE